MLESVSQFVKENVPDHLQGLWSPDIETQLSFQDGSVFRIPKDGNSAEPYFHDHDYHPPLNTLLGIGVTGWDWIDKRSVSVTIDLDSIANHDGGHDQQKLDEIVRLVSLIEQAEIIRSKSGEGYHLRMFFGDNVRA